MSCTKYNKKSTCSKSFAVCVEYQGELSEYTELDPDSCYDVEEVIEDLTTILDGVKDQLDLSELEGSCITYPAGEKVLLDYLKAIQDKICEQNDDIIQMKQEILTLQNQVAELQANPCP